jgi:hypothetical protein
MALIVALPASVGMPKDGLVWSPPKGVTRIFDAPFGAGVMRERVSCIAPQPVEDGRNALDAP